MKLKLLAAALLALSTTPGAAQQQQRSVAPTARPKLVVVISVDQFSADLFAEYRGLYTGGLRRLSQGVVFPSGYQSHAATETCPGHSTILTGDRPGRTGIIANNWYDQSATRTDKYIYCAEDERVAGSSSDHYTVSDLHLRVPTLGDLMQRVDPRSRVVAVAGKDRAAVMMGGHNPTERWYWGGRAFVSDRAGAREPGPVTQANNRITTALTRPRDAMSLPDACQSRDRAIPLAAGASVGTGRFARGENDRSGFRASPDFDREILTIAEGMRDDMRLGEGASTDLLIIGLSATDYIGHSFGTRGTEMCIQQFALDRILGDFFQDLDREGVDYVVMLTADHGGIDLPERSAETGAPTAARVDPALNATAMGQALGRRLRLQGPVLLGDGAFGDMWIDRSLAPRVRTRVLAEAVRAYEAHPQVQTVFTRAELAATPLPSGPPETWSLIQRARASFDPERSGDLYVVLKPRITPIATTGRGYVATHGSIWDYDRRVPILFWRRGMTGFEQPLSVETVDIMPSLAGLIGLPLATGSVDGRCLDLIVGPGTSCPN